jgi:transposase
MKVNRIGIDLAKNVFEVYGVDEHERPVLRRRLRRVQMRAFFAQLPPCLIGMEACGGAHYWARELGRLGHEVRLIAPQFVAPYRKNDKNDRNDAEAICEAVGRPNMRFVPVKSAEQQAVLALHRLRQRLVRERTALVNQARGLLAEYGIVLPEGRHHLRRQLAQILDKAEAYALPALACEVFAELYDRYVELEARVQRIERRIEQMAREDETARRLMKVEGVGPLIASAIVASLGDARLFRNGRQFAAWLGLVPRQYSSGGKLRQGRITKRGDRYLRTLLVHGARSALHAMSRREDDARGRWVRALKERRGRNKAIVALAARNARVLWALLAHGREYAPTYRPATA